MSLLPAGTYALIKSSDEPTEQFVVVFVEPDKVDRPGYLWGTSGAMSQEQATIRLGEMGVRDDRIPAIIEAAREQFAAQQTGT